MALRVEQREPGGRPRAARRAVDLAVGEHRHVPLRERPVFLVLPEDHAVHVPKLGLERVDDVVLGLDRGLELPPECDQARQLAGRDAFLEARVERPAVGDVDDAARRLDPLPPDERGDVSGPHRAHAASSTLAHVWSRPEGTSTTTRFSPSRRSTTPSSSAHVTSAIVPCPHAVEYPAL